MILLRDTEIDGRRGVDVRIADGFVIEIAPALTAYPGETVIDANGGAVLPGLCDHHLHLLALASWTRSIHCGPPEVSTPNELRTALATARPDDHGWIRGVGYTETVAGDLDARALDGLHEVRPMRIQHRSGALWTVNTRGLGALGVADADHPGIERDHHGNPTGRLYRADHWLRARLPAATMPDLAPIGAQLAELGITAVTDASPDLDETAIAAITSAMTARTLPQRVLLLGAPLAWSSPGTPHTPKTGPYKIVLADSGLPALPVLTEQIRRAHAAGRAVAVHCVTRVALVLLLAAFADAGIVAGDRIEHAALVPAELIAEIGRLKLRVVTQPGFLAHRGDDFLRDVPADEHADLYRARSLLAAGIPLTSSSDAPYGPLDPWAVIAAAVHRETPLGRTAGAEERLTVDQALAGYLSPPDDPGGPPRRVRVGMAADLALLRIPRAELLRDSADPVRATIINGEVIT